MNLFARFSFGAFPCFGGKEEILAMLFHPRTNPQLRFAVARRCVNVIDAVLKQQLQRGIGLSHFAQRRRAEDRPCAVMSRTSKSLFSNHGVSPSLKVYRKTNFWTYG